MKKWLDRHIDYWAVVICFSAGWFGNLAFSCVVGAYRLIPMGIALVMTLLVMRWIDVRVTAVRHDAYEAGIAAEKQRQNEYTEQAFEIPHPGDLMR
jgi:uncharacterized membrane protein (DUF485 family)